MLQGLQSNNYHSLNIKERYGGGKFPPWSMSHRKQLCVPSEWWERGAALLASLLLGKVGPADDHEIFTEPVLPQTISRAEMLADVVLDWNKHNNYPEASRAWWQDFKKHRKAGVGKRVSQGGEEEEQLRTRHDGTYGWRCHSEAHYFVC